jgi:dimethylamine/trimethylamine dehydrogenase
VAIATGAKFVRDGRGRHSPQGLPVAPGVRVLTPDDVFQGARPDGPLLILDDDHATLGSALAEKFAREGLVVTLATPAVLVGFWTQLTLEQAATEARLVSLGVELRTRVMPAAIGPGALHFTDGTTGKDGVLPFASLLHVGAREAVDALAHGLLARRPQWAEAGLRSVARIGDCEVPAMIVHAVYSGRRYAEELDDPPDPDRPPFRRDPWRP